jgi:hypothetical protein
MALVDSVPREEFLVRTRHGCFISDGFGLFALRECEDRGESPALGLAYVVFHSCCFWWVGDADTLVGLSLFVGLVELQGTDET